TARVARVDRRVRLDEVLERRGGLLVPVDDPELTTLRTHDPGRRRRAQVQRVAERDDPVTDRDQVRIAQLHDGQPVRIDLEHRDVRVRIAADDLLLELPPVLEHDRDPLRALDHVVVRQDVAVRPEDEARPATLPGRRRRLPAPEEVLERRAAGPATPSTAGPRSEEHTSELQSRENLVCRLLLEKKKKETNRRHKTSSKALI